MSKRKSKEHNIIFVDCFNTIILRRKSNKAIIVEWAKRISQKYNIEYKKFYRTYNKINFKLSLKKVFVCGAFEECIKAVLTKIYFKFSKYFSLYSLKDFIKTSQDIYSEEEMRCHFVNEDFIAFLRAEKSKGKKIYVVSDFYCSASIIKNWLNNLGIIEIFDDVFSSCDFEKEKMTTKLYKYLLDRLNIKASDVMMYGDNIWSDYYMAKRSGLNAKRVKYKGKNMIKNKTIVNSDWDEIFYSGDINFSNYAFPLALFTARLYNELVANGENNVLFMSREGQFLKKLFDRYIEIRKELKLDISPINTYYFYGSRNSVMAASMKKLSEENFSHLFRFFRYFMSAKRFMYSIGFSEEQIAKVRTSFGKRTDKTCFNFAHSSIFRKLKKNKVFNEIYENNRKTQGDVFGKYMDSFGINYQKEGLVFVDIGYHGTMQDCIYKFFNQSIPIKGYYIKSRVRSVGTNIKVGLLGDKVNQLLGEKITQYDTFNYEQVLRADHGRCVKYEIDSKTGAVTPVLDDKRRDKDIFEAYVGPMQDKIMVKFEQIIRKGLNEKLDLSNICSLYNYYLIKNKSNDDFKWLLDMQDCHHDAFGYVGYGVKPIKRGLRKFALRFKDKFFLLKWLYIHNTKKRVLSDLGIK